MEHYIFSQSSMRLLKVSQEGFLNPMFAVAHNYADLTGCDLNNALKRVALTSFYVGNSLYFNGKNTELPEILTEIPENLLEIEVPEINGEPFSPFDYYSDPDFILISFQDYSIWDGLSEAVYLGHFKKGREKWNFYYFPRYQIPDISEMANLKGIVFTGGKYNIGESEWKDELLSLIITAYERGIKLVGICLGHQSIALALGGNIGKNPSNEFIYEIEECKSKGDSFIGSYRVAEIHSECVISPPSNMEVLHSSSSTGIESLYLKGKILSFQGHPEFSSSFMIDVHLPMMFNKGSISNEKFEKERLSYSTVQVDTPYIIAKINEFLRDSNL